MLLSTHQSSYKFQYLLRVQLNMSTERLKIFKVKAGDVYSKNAIIDSLIKQKLDSQMKIVKDNFNQILNRDQNKPKTNQNNSIRKRRLSHHTLSSLNPDKIKSNLQFNPVAYSSVYNFIVNRQKQSALIEKQKLEQLNFARVNHEDFTVKVKGDYEIRYQDTFKINNSFNREYFSKLQQKIKPIIPNDIWLPDLPEVNQINQKQQQRFFEIKADKNNSYKLSATDKNDLSSFKTIISHTKHKDQTQIAHLSQEFTYQVNKFHKNDYNSLQKWLQVSLFQVGQLEWLIKQQNSKYDLQSLKYEQLLKDIVYSIYMSSFKQLIRLTYIQSCEKGIVFQKIIWSFIRLIKSIIEEQHKANYNDFSEYCLDSKQMKNIYENRIAKLEVKLKETEQLLKQTGKNSNLLVSGFLSYKKVNQEMFQEIQSILKKSKKLEVENSFLSKQLMRIVQSFLQKDVIFSKKQPDCVIYYFLNQNEKAEIIAKVPKNLDVQTFYHRKAIEAGQEYELENSLLKKSSVISNLDNELNLYWEKKRDNLLIQEIVNGLTYSFLDESTQANGNGPIQSQDYSTQFPEESNESFSQFLKRQFESQKTKWLQKQQNYNTLTISLQDLYNEANRTIQMLSTQNSSYKTNIDQLKQQNDYLTRKISQIDEKLNLYSKKINYLENDIQELQKLIEKKQSQIVQSMNSISNINKKYYFEKENNNILAKNLFEIKQIKQKLNQKFDNLENKIKILAPQFEKLIQLSDLSQNSTLKKICSMILQHLSEYVQRDAGLFLTK